MTGTETETNGGRETKRQRGKQTDTQTLPHNHKHTCWHTATLVDGQLVSHFTGLHGLYQYRHVLLGDSVSCRHTERDNERNNDTVSDVTFFHTHTHTPPTHCWHMDETVCTRD